MVYEMAEKTTETIFSLILGLLSLFQGRRAEKVLWAVALLSLVFIIAEFVGGFFASSLAIMTDAGHMLSDLLSFVISIVAIRTARQPRKCYPHYLEFLIYPGKKKLHARVRLCVSLTL